MDITFRVKNPTTKLNWFDKINLVWSIGLILILWSSAFFIFGASWMSDLDVYSAQITAQ